MSSYAEMARAVLAEMARTAMADSPEGAEATMKAPEFKAAPHGEFSLKGNSVELWCDHAGGRVFIVADEEDAEEAVKRFGAPRGEVWIPGEIELVARIEDQAIRHEVAGFKRKLDGCLSPDANSEGVSPEEWRAAVLNRLFQEQGATGKPGRITAATVQNGERKGTKGSEDHE